MFFSIEQNNTSNITDFLTLKETTFGYIITDFIKSNEKENFLGFILHLHELNENLKKFLEI